MCCDLETLTRVCADLERADGAAVGVPALRVTVHGQPGGLHAHHAARGPHHRRGWSGVRTGSRGHGVMVGSGGHGQG